MSSGASSKSSKAAGSGVVLLVLVVLVVLEVEVERGELGVEALLVVRLVVGLLLVDGQDGGRQRVLGRRGAAVLGGGEQRGQRARERVDLVRVERGAVEQVSARPR